MIIVIVVHYLGTGILYDKIWEKDYICYIGCGFVRQYLIII